MSVFRRIIPYLVMGASVFIGAFLIMGNFRTDRSQALHLQQSRVEALARKWENRLQQTRAAFRDQMIHSGLLVAIERPEEWSASRISSKFEGIVSGWSRENGELRSLSLLTEKGDIHTFYGDTTKLGQSVRGFDQNELLDFIVYAENNGKSPILSLQYFSPAADPSIHSGRVIAMIETRNLFDYGSNGPDSWVLMESPERVLASAPRGHVPLQVNNATWSLLIAEGSGMVKVPGNGTLCFSRIQLPGMSPLLLVEPISSRTAWVPIAGFLAILGGIISFVLRRRVVPISRDKKEDASASSEAHFESKNLRQIFQKIEDPLCVIDQNGAVVRANRAAQEWLRLQHGKLPDEFIVRLSSGVFSLKDFLAHAAQDSTSLDGEGAFAIHDDVRLGDIRISRLSRDEAGHGSVMLHIRPHPQAPAEPTASAEKKTASRIDRHAPYPILAVNLEGVIIEYNHVALKACPRLEQTQSLMDILPALEASSIQSLFRSEEQTQIESLFGSQTYQFSIVREENTLRLYGQTQAVSQQLDIELKQAQENFFSLCGMVTVPVLLGDPREHTVIEANAAAADLWETTPQGLRGRSLDSLTDEPWDLSVEGGNAIVVTPSERRIPCEIRYELIKTEGIPTLLIVVEPQAQPAYVSSFEAPVLEESIVETLTTPSVLAELPTGPGLLIAMNPTVREVARRFLDKMERCPESFTSLDDATVWLITHDFKPEFIAMDLTDYEEGESWIDEVRARCGDVPCVAFTDGDGYALAATGPNAYLRKPFDLDSFAAAFESVLFAEVA